MITPARDLCARAREFAARVGLRSTEYRLHMERIIPSNPISLGGKVHVRFVSSLMPEDEDRIAPGLLQAIRALLDQMPIAYTVRIETESGTVLQHHHTSAESAPVFLGGASPLESR